MYGSRKNSGVEGSTNAFDGVSKLSGLVISPSNSGCTTHHGVSDNKVLDHVEVEFERELFGHVG